jgi:methionyl aminopeptidase
VIKLKSGDEIRRIGEAGQILADTMRKLAGSIDEGITTLELDRIAHDEILRHGAKPTFLGYMDFPASLCVSINEEVIHGIPGKKKLKLGDLISLDLGVNLRGFYADAAWTFAVGKISEQRRALMEVTRRCLDLAVQQAHRGRRVQDIGRAVSGEADRHGYGVVRQFCGHGVGFAQHEDPQVPNYVGHGPNPRLKTGMVLALEPMLNTGTWEVEVLDDGWTVRTVDHSDSAHYEYTVAVMDDHVEVLTPLE